MHRSVIHTHTHIYTYTRIILRRENKEGDRRWRDGTQAKDT